MTGLQKKIVILSAARTPFGKFCGALKGLSATELGAIAGRAAVKRAGNQKGLSLSPFNSYC